MSSVRGELVRVYEFEGHRFGLDGYENPDDPNPDDPNADYDYYDLFDAEDGTCLNLGDPLYAIPTEEEVRAYIRSLDGPGDTVI